MKTMLKNSERTGTHEQWARFRFSVVGPLLAAPHSRGELQSFNTTVCYCTNSSPGAGTVWPQVQINVDQTNGTPARVYHLKMIAMPVPRLTSIIPQTDLGNVHLEWSANGQKVQLEKAETVNGPYTALGGATTDSSFTDVGALTNRSETYYRLRWQ
jgi:hypothetical protein